jgi:hypothetical protein
MRVTLLPPAAGRATAPIPLTRRDSLTHDFPSRFVLATSGRRLLALRR